MAAPVILRDAPPRPRWDANLSRRHGEPDNLFRSFHPSRTPCTSTLARGVGSP